MLAIMGIAAMLRCLGKPMDAFLRGGRSKRSKDFDLDATLRLRWAWPTICFPAFSSIFNLIRVLPEQQVSLLKPSSFVEEANHNQSNVALG